MDVVLLVLAIVAGVALIQAAIWVPLIRRWRRRERESLVELRAELQRTGEQVVLGPEAALYRGATTTYGQIKGNGRILLTDRRLMFRKITGGEVVIPVERITGTHTAPAFLGARVGGKTHLVVSTNDPAEVGFFVNDIPAWQRALGGESPSA